MASIACRRAWAGPRSARSRLKASTPLLAGVLDALGDEMRGVGAAAARHGDVCRGGAGRVAEGDVGVVNGLALGSVDRGGVGELDEPGDVLRRDLAIAPVAVKDQAAVLADAGDDPSLAVRDPEVGVVAAGGDAVPGPDPFAASGHQRWVCVGRVAGGGVGATLVADRGIEAGHVLLGVGDDEVAGRARLGEGGGAFAVARVDHDRPAPMHRLEDCGRVVAGAHA